jgi:hypothetical protein
MTAETTGMTSMRLDPRLLLAGAALGALALTADPVTRVLAHDSGHAQGQPAPAAAPEPGSRFRITMEELHRRADGVPRGWKFAVPAGDAARGKQAFADFECYKCHVVKDAGFPSAPSEPGNIGPELTGMGAAHPPAYIAESILAPDHVVVLGPGFTDPGGRSTMPSYTDSLSVTQWLDLVAYIGSLTVASGDSHAGHETAREAVAGAYRLRVVFAPHDATGGHGAHGHAATPPPAPRPDERAGAVPHHHGAVPAPSAPAPATGAAGERSSRQGHLMVFVMDGQFGEAVPYLPVTATLHAAGSAPRTVKLGPMMSDRGFHYGADVAMPARTTRITLAIGAATMAVAGTGRERYRKPVTATVSWE